MNYKDINRTILESSFLPKTIEKNKEFYSYLLGNNVAYYYCSCLSTYKTTYDKKVIHAGNVLNKKYIKTLKFINEVCKKNKVKYLLFKSYKYIPEVIDNDIDIIVSEKNFNKFVLALKNEGFKCYEEGNGKARCIKNSYCKIEPRVFGTVNGIEVLDVKTIWKNSELVTINGMRIKKTRREIDVAYQLLSILYNPNYLKLYTLLVYKKSDKKSVIRVVTDIHIKQDLLFLIKRLVSKNIYDKKFPLFMGNTYYVTWWINRIIPNTTMNVYAKLKLILYFLYSKYLYIFFNRLVFRHMWPLLED